MALINCPECGQQNVSDKAEMCPVCGYGIKAHFERERQIEHEKLIYQIKLDSVKKPEMPKKNNSGYSNAIFMVIGAIVWLFFSFIIHPFFLILAILQLTCIPLFISDGNKQYEKEMRKYNLAMTDYEKYQKEMVEEQERKAHIESLKPKCPHCNSTNITKISSIDRSISVKFWGLASDKIGKQYKCNSCKHMW